MSDNNDFGRNTDTVSSRQHPSLSVLEKKQFVLMGVVNVTPDSFFDGGMHNTVQSACDHARRLLEEGADILDIGGESSRPGSLPVSVDNERKRVLPVIEELRKETDIPISIDTTKATVAGDALDAGATWINDISAGRFDPTMTSLVAGRQCPVILMHSRKTPETMQIDPEYDDVVSEVIDELLECVKLFTDSGVFRENVIIDPGIGFAKRHEDNIEIVRNLDRIVKTGFPVLIGTSRKSFIGHIIGKEAEHRLYGTLGSVAAAYLNGAKIFRVHDVDETKDFLHVFSTIEVV
jgi:dihydropteroate synthase